MRFANAEKLNVNPRELGDPNIWTWVVEPKDEICIKRKRKPKATTLKELKRNVVKVTYDQMPAPAIDQDLVARNNRYPLPGSQNNVSAFTLTRGNQTKFSAFVVTNTDGDDDQHWALEDTNAFPDGVYLLTVRAWNIAKSNGIGKQPGLNLRRARYLVGVRSYSSTSKRASNSAAQRVRK